MLRSDLMLERKCGSIGDFKRPYCCWKQVEINAIASGFGHLGPISRELQRCYKFCPIYFYFFPFFVFSSSVGQ